MNSQVRSNKLILTDMAELVTNIWASWNVIIVFCTERTILVCGLIVRSVIHISPEQRKSGTVSDLSRLRNIFNTYSG